MSAPLKLRIRAKSPVAVGAGISIDGIEPVVRSCTLVQRDGIWLAQMEVEVEPDIELDVTGPFTLAGDLLVRNATAECNGKPVTAADVESITLVAGEPIVVAMKAREVHDA